MSGVKGFVRFSTRGSGTGLAAAVLGFLIAVPLAAWAEKPGGLSPPEWLSPLEQHSDDGRAELHWATADLPRPGLFRLTEKRGGAEFVSFVDTMGLRLHRVEPGKYDFWIQACEKSADGEFSCGKRSARARLNVSDGVYEHAMDISLPWSGETAAPAFDTVDGGPDQLQPGLWFNPARNGHGWSFYWANRMALPESHSQHGYSYDLLGVWYSYEAKTRYLDGFSVCTGQDPASGCEWVYGNYEPVVLRLKLVRSGSGTYSGGIYVTRNGQEFHEGTATVTFGGDNASATVEWAADFKLQRLSGTDPIELLSGSIPEEDRNITHYAGTWDLQNDQEKMVVNDVGSFNEGIELVFPNDAGDPTWVQASIGSSPQASAAPLCFYWVVNGFAPGTDGGALQYYSSGCDMSLPGGAGNRNGGREFTAFEQQRFWVSFVLPASTSGGKVNIGSASYPALLRKSSNFHRIWFASESSSCEISGAVPSCPVEISWFTDGDYPRASVFVLNQDTGQRRRLVISPEPAVTAFTADLDEPGSHRFELRMGDTAQSTLIARSAAFSVAEVAIPATGELTAAWMDREARHFRLQWSHRAPEQIDWYELEERSPPSGSAAVHVLPVSLGTAREFEYAAGPFGSYAYRVRACRSPGGEGNCSDWSASLDWLVSEPQNPAPQFLRPWAQKSAASGSLITGIGFQYAMGYHFRAHVNGFIKELGGLFEGSKTVKVFDRQSGVELTRAQISSNNSWSFVAVSPVAISAGREYTIAVYLKGSGGSYYSTPRFPLVYEELTVLGSTYVSTSSDATAVPTNQTLAAMYGQVDMGFEAAKEIPNSPPSLESSLPDRENEESDVVSFQVQASDPDGDSLSFDAEGLPAGLSMDSLSGRVEGTIADGASVSSPYAVRVSVSDPAGLEDARSFSWQVNAAPEPNRPPVLAQPADRSDAVGDYIELSFEVFDPDGDPVSCQIQGLPADLAGTGGCAVSGTITAEPRSYTVSVTAADAMAQSLPVFFEWRVRASDSLANPAVPPPPAGPPVFTIDAAAVSAGFTSGAFSVDEKGSANYDLPIVTAPGSGGFSPAVSLSYNSQLPNGVLGVGWQISGLSSITRCAGTREQDGLEGNRGITMTSEDRFCLDGQRLMVVEGAYGSEGAEYRTETDGFARIVSHGTAGSGPRSFRVWHADGSVSEYGMSEDSRLETRQADLAGTVLSWARNRSQDSSGNYVDFVYHETSGFAVEHTIDSIRYTGNLRAGTAPYAEIRFAYRDERADISESFVSGEWFSRRRLLERVDSVARVRASDASFQPLRSYFITYGQDGFGRKTLESIEECNAPQRQYCFSPLVFEWLKTEHGIGGGGLPAGSLFSRDFRDLAVADVNGDGRQDLLIIEENQKRFNMKVAFASEISGFALDSRSYDIPANGLDGLPVRLTSLDLNADGFEDIVYPRESAGGVNWVARLSSGSGFGSEQIVAAGCCGSTKPLLMQIMDFNGDGLGDLLTNRVSPDLGGKGELVVLLNGFQPGGGASLEPYRALSIELSQGLFPTDAEGWILDEQAPQFRNVYRDSAVGAQPFDYNGDGKVDLLAKISRRYAKCSGDCTVLDPGDAADSNSLDTEIVTEFIFPDGEGSFSGSPQGSNSGSDFATVSFFILFEADGEGRYVENEILARGAGSDCDLAELCASWSQLPGVQKLLPADINADGLADIAYMDGSSHWFYRLNTGRGFRDPVMITQSAGFMEGVRAAFVDINGDAYPELIYPEAVSSQTANWKVHFNDLGNGFAAAERSEMRHGNTDDGDAGILLDFNGDGMLDNLFIDLSKSGVSSSTTRLYLGRNLVTGRPKEPSNVISLIREGSGAMTRLHYAPLTDASVYTKFRGAGKAQWGRGSPVIDVVTPLYVVSEVTASLPTAADPLASQRIEYHYAGARIQTGGRGFLGFAERASWNPQSGIRSNTRFRQDFPFIGLPLDSTRALSPAAEARHLLSNPLSAEPALLSQFDESLAPPAVGAASVLLEYSANHWNATETRSGAGSWWPSLQLALSRSYTLLGNARRSVLVTNAFESYGRLMRTVSESWSPDSGLPLYTQTTEHSYRAPDLSRWILRKPSRTVVTHSRPGTPDIVRESSFEQDPLTGLLIEEVIEPSRNDLLVKTEYGLDVFGNRIETAVTAQGLAARNAAMVFDALGRFPVQSLNHFGQSIQTVLDWDAFGNVLETRNIGGVLSLAASDAMGRLYGQWTGTGASFRTLRRLGPGSSCPQQTAIHSVKMPAGGAREISCLDKLGREIRGATEGFDGRLVLVDRYYDALGRPERVSEPYFQDEQRYWNYMTYDELGRVTRVDTAAGDTQWHAYDEAAGGVCAQGRPEAESVTNALGQKSIEWRNALGEKVAVFDDACGQISYGYDAIGNLLHTTGADGARISMTYDLAGRRISVDDPDKGFWQYRWNALGEMSRQLDAKRQAWDFSYDALGRLTERRELSSVDSLQDPGGVVRHRELREWQNSASSAVSGKGQLLSVIYQNMTSGETVHRLDYGYDSFGRRISSSDSRGSLQFSEQTSFDQYGRIFQVFDASGDYRGIQYTYNSYGYIEELKDSRDVDSGLVFQRNLSMDSRGNPTGVELGNGVQLFADHDPATGKLEKQRAYDIDGLALQDVDYLFDALGNLLQRHDRSNGRDLMEDFSYDNLNRLERVELTAPAAGISNPLETLALTYGASGNIDWKSDVGSYRYGEGPAGPHALTTAGGHSYSYDANGNQVSGNGRSIEYSLFDKPLRIEKNGQSVEFSYGAGRQRIARIDRNAANEEKITHYAGSVEYIEDASGTKFRRYLGGVAIAEYFPSTGVSRSRYLVKDHIGSIHSMTTESGKVADAMWMSFNAFGERRSADWSGPLSPVAGAALIDWTARGFTGHEHVDGLGVVHMNGRIYDPRLGRFLQADPYVQAPDDSQSLNRYSYAQNNPLSFTDPSGFFLKRLVKRWGRLVVAIAISIFLPGPQGFLAMQFGVTNVYLQAAVTGFVAGAITSGSLKGAVIGAVTAVAVTGLVQAYSASKPGSGLASYDKLAPKQSTLDHLYGPSGPPEGLYRITVTRNGKFVGQESISAAAVRNGEVIFTNGIKNGFQQSIRNATRHLNQVGMLGESYVLNFNPTQGFLPDLLEASADIIGAHTGWAHSRLARNLAQTLHQVSESGVQGIRLVGHSQGGAIVASALRHAHAAGLNLSSLAGGSAALHGAPVNAWLARSGIGGRTGVAISSRAQFGDAVHVLGGLNISNPLELPVALLRFPAIFSRDAGLSPHTLPCAGGTGFVCGK